MDKILVHIDLQYDSAALLEKAIFIAKQYGAYVELFSCCYNRSITYGYIFDQEQEQHAEHAYVRQTEAKLEKLCSTLNKAGVETGFDACWDRHTSEAIIRKVLRFQPDLLMHGIQPHTRIGHYLFAALDWQIARQSPVPVLFVKERPWKELIRLSACIDPLHLGDEYARLDQAIMRFTQPFSEGCMAELRVLHCYNTLSHEAIFDEHLVTDFEVLQDKAECLHKDKCNSMLREFDLSTDDHNVDLLKGEPGEVISQYSQHNEIDIVVMGAVARSVLDRLLVGSTMEYVVDHVDSDVLLIKAPDFVCPVSE